MNKIISYFNLNKSNGNKKFTIFKRKSVIADKQHTTLNKSSSNFTIQSVTDQTLLNKSQFFAQQDITVESATLEEMYSDNINVLESSIKLLTFNKLNESTKPSKNVFNIDSVNSIDSTIKSKLANLKTTARELNIQLPAQITMLETVYNLRMNTLTQEYLTNQKKYQEKRHARNALVKHFINASKLFRNMKSSVDISSSKQTKINHLDQEIKKQMDSIQNELLTTICEIEFKFQKQRQNKQTTKNLLSFKPNKSNYSTEVSMQKRIRTTRKRLHKTVLVISSSSDLKQRKNKQLNISFAQ